MITLTAIGHKQRRNRNYRRVWPVAPTSGIGTTSPGGALQVNGNTILGGALSTSGGDFSFMDAGVADSTAVRLMSNSGNLFLQNGSGGNTYFRNKMAATVMTVQNGGNVGIGSTAPTQALDVNGTIRAAHVSITGSSCSWSAWACMPTCAAGYYQAGTMMGAANNCNGTGPNVQIYCCSF